MIRISDAIDEIVGQNALLQFGFSERLLNLSQVAKFIQPLIEARTKKTVRTTAILMQLSRMQRRFKKINAALNDFGIETITIYSNLCSLTFFKTEKLHLKINQLLDFIQERKGYITITEGVGEITLILDQVYFAKAEQLFTEKPRNVTREIASVGIKFHEKYATTPGLLYRILQQVTLQNINLVEISSTYTEFILYVNQSEVNLAFDTLFNTFGKSSPNPAGFAIKRIGQ